MDTVESLKPLSDRNVLLEAHAASSAYVMQKAFAASEKLNAFRGRKDLAPAILAKIEELSANPGDPVILGAHLYVLELIGAKPELKEAILRLLENDGLRADPLIGQQAGEIAIRQAKPDKRLDPGANLSIEDLKDLADALKQSKGD